MKKILNFLFSFPFMGFLLLIFAFSMAIATFVESTYSTEAAQGLIFKAKWFELLLLLLTANLLVNFFKYRMYLPQRISVGLFHISFIIILIGAAVTRYVSFEGVMHIREGFSSDYILSSDSYITVKSGGKAQSTQVLFSELKQNSYEESLKINGKTIDIKSLGFIKGASKSVVENKSGNELIDFVISAGQGRLDLVCERGSSIELENFSVGFENNNSNIQFLNRNDEIFLVADRDLEIHSMSGGQAEKVLARDTVLLKTMHLYAFDGYMLLVKRHYINAFVTAVKDNSGNSKTDAVILELTAGNESKIVSVFGHNGSVGDKISVKLGSEVLDINYGSEVIYLPFKLKLIDFQLEKYPGSDSPASFASELVLIDVNENISRNVRVFMNNTLTYKGYKFFQSSYDQDELGTVLSVNADMPGTIITYIGYFLMTLGMILALFSKNSYFRVLINRLKQSPKFAAILIFGFLFLANNNLYANKNELSGLTRLDSKLVEDFSNLWVQGPDGRIEPVSTLASELLRKLCRKSDFYGFEPEEVMLGVYFNPEIWKNISLIKIDGKQMQDLLSVENVRVPITSFFDEKGEYKLAEYAKAAHNKMPVYRNIFDKEIINVDERVNIFFMMLHGEMFKLFPGYNKSDKWHPAGSNGEGLNSDDALFVRQGLMFLKESIEGDSEIKPTHVISSIAAYQNKFGKDYLPSDTRKKLEIIYNKVSPFKKVFLFYLLVGFILLSVLFINIFRQKTISNPVKYSFLSLISLGFLFHTAGLALRWYISGHAPWSNGYESMVYIAWATMLSGIIFGRKYPMVLGAGSILAGITLFVAHLNWMNPEITNLVPVLNSYWLMIHVAIITASYGFFGLSAILGFIVLILYSLSKKGNSNISIINYVNQLTTINEMSITIGLYLLTIGTFLGGVWANESWGRYWGWDPKETWALVTVVIYSFIAHMRMIPALKGIYNYNVASVLSFASVLMTYFGVNYFLSGLHSYGRGTVDSLHWSVFLTIGIIAVLMIFSSFKQKNLEFEK